MAEIITVQECLDRLDNRLQSLRFVVRVMARVLGMDWSDITRRARLDMEADEAKRAEEARKAAPSDA